MKLWMIVRNTKSHIIYTINGKEIVLPVDSKIFGVYTAKEKALQMFYKTHGYRKRYKLKSVDLQEVPLLEIDDKEKNSNGHDNNQ